MGQGEDAVAVAASQAGKPYVFGAQGPNAYDCSGLVKYAYAHAHPPLDLPHWTWSMLPLGKEVARSELQAGDLVFPHGDHVQLYAGDGTVWEAPDKGIPVRNVPIGVVWHARRVAVGKGGGPAIFNPLDPVSVGLAGAEVGANLAGAKDAVTGPLEQWGKVASTVTSVVFWRRVGMFSTGVVLIVFGVIFLRQRALRQAGATIVRTAGQAAATVGQGYAFGLGATAGGKAGTGGGGSSGTNVVSDVIAPKPRAPKPPPAAIGPPPPNRPRSATPVTAILPEVAPRRVKAEVGSRPRPGPIASPGTRNALSRPLPGEGTGMKPRRLRKKK